MEEEEDAYHLSLDVQARREARAARLMGGAALAIALMAISLFALVVPRLLSPATPTAAALSQLSVSDSIGLNADPTSFAQAQIFRGWCRTYLNSTVRNESGLDSPLLRVIPAGSLVFIREQSGGRVRISQPISGWMSTATSDGVGIMYPDMLLKGSDESVDLDKVIRSDSQRNVHARVQEKVAELTAVQQRLAKAMRKLKERTTSLKKNTDHVSQRVTQEAPKVAQSLAHRAETAAKKVVSSKDAQHLLQDLAHQPNIKGLFN